MKPEKITVADTPGLLALATDACQRNSNRQVDIPKLALAIDPDGTHILTFQMPHNDVEWRTKWLVKMADTMDPVEIWLDVSFEALSRESRRVAVKGLAKSLEVAPEGAEPAKGP